MTLMVTLDAETERAIETQAARLGITPAQYLARLAEKESRQASSALDQTGSLEALGALQNWLGEDPATKAAHAIPLDALTRDELYAEREADAA